MKKEINEIFSALYKENPNPQTELQHVNEYTLLVAIILSAQMTDAGVNKATKALFEKVQTAAQMIDLGEEGLASYIKSINLFKTKARNVIKMSKTLLESHSGNVPSTIEDLLTLAGVGEKTARVFLNCIHNMGYIAVDTHVFRVSNRLGIAQAKTPNEMQKKLPNYIPKEWHKLAHHLLILHGRYVCKARKPKCLSCGISSFCEYKDKNLTN